MPRPKTIADGFPRALQLLRHFWPELKKEKPLIGGAFLALFASVIFRLLEPWPLKYVIDDILTPTLMDSRQRPDASNFPATWLTLVVLGLVAIVAVRATSDYYRSVSFALIGNRVMSRIRSRLYQHLQSLSLSFHNKRRSGDLLVRVIGDIKLLRDVVVTALLPLFGSVLLLVGMFAVMFFLNWRLTLLSLAVLPLFGLSTVRLGKRIHSAARKQRQREGAMAATAAEAINSVQAVQAMSLEERFEGSFTSQEKRSVSEGVKTRRLAARLERTTDILVAVATAAVLWYGTRLALAGTLSTGELIVFLTYLKRGFRPLQDFAKYAGRLAKATAAGERVVELLEETPDIADAPDAVDAPPLQGRIEFANLQFAYDREVRVYDGFSCTIQPGSYVALVGDSGVGKSTLLNLLLRFYDPQSGSVMIDGQDIRGWTLASLRRQISVVLQDTVLFAGNVYDNIALGASEVTPEQIIEAAKLANAHDFICRLPEGYETMLGERGCNLSRGQRQRIAIARAAIRNAPLLLLDEPTTGLDEQNQLEVYIGLRRLAAGRTTLHVTHDLRQAAAADLIIYIDRDGCHEQGSHADLLLLDGKYTRIFQSYTSPHVPSPKQLHNGVPG